MWAAASDTVDMHIVDGSNDMQETVLPDRLRVVCFHREKAKKKKKGKQYWSQQPSEAKVKDEQIKPLFDSIEREEHTDKKNLIKLFFYLGQHPFTEVSMMRWEQLSEDNGQWWWNMEEGFHKVKDLKHTVYLHPVVMNIINRQKGKDDTHVFNKEDLDNDFSWDHNT